MPTGYIYEIKSNDKSITGLYIGSCWDMKDRLRRHAGDCYNETGVKYNYPVYRYIRENGNFHTFNMTVIDSGECEDRTELRCAEQFYIDMAGGIDNLLNVKDALVSPEERIKRKDISVNNSHKKNIENKKYPCELCGFYFQSNSKKQKHLDGRIHKKNLTIIAI
jgi:hypothetical protein